MALAVRLRNGLLGEGFLGLRRHLEAVGAAAASPAAAAEAQRRHARLLVGQLLQFAALVQPSAVNAVVRMPLGALEEEVRSGAVVGGGGMEGGTPSSVPRDWCCAAGLLAFLPQLGDYCSHRDLPPNRRRRWRGWRARRGRGRRRPP